MKKSRQRLRRLRVEALEPRIVLSLLPSPLPTPITARFVIGGDNDWINPQNWINVATGTHPKNAPGAGSTAIFNLAGSATVNVNTRADIGNLEVDLAPTNVAQLNFQTSTGSTENVGVGLGKLVNCRGAKQCRGPEYFYRRG